MQDVRITSNKVSLFFDHSWFRDVSSSTVFLRAHISVGIPLQELAGFSQRAVHAVTLEVPIKITWVRLLHFPDGKIDSYYTVDDEGQLGILIDERNIELPVANYAIFASPSNINGAEIIPTSVIKADFDKVAALIRAYSGKNTLYRMVSEGIYSAHSGNVLTPTSRLSGYPLCWTDQLTVTLFGIR